MRRTAFYAVGALLLAGIGLAVATRHGGGDDPRPDGDLDPADAAAEEASDAPADVGRATTASLSGAARSRVRRAGEPGRVRVAVRRGDDGSAVPDVSLVLEGTPSGGWPFALQAWTDREGRAVFERVPEGVGYRLVTQLGASMPVERKGIGVVAGLETDVGTVVLLSAGIVLGMVLREDGSPIQDAVVTATTHPETLLDLDQDPWPLAPEPPFFAAKTTTDLAGHFRLVGVPPGLVAIRATAAGFRGRTARTWVPPQATSPGWVDMVLRTAPSLRVRVVDLKYLPLPGVAVSAGTWEDPRFLVRVEGTTDEKGVYELSGFLTMPMAALLLPAAEGDAHVLFRGVGRVKDASCQVVASAKVTVRVLAKEDGRPVGGAQVMLEMGRPPELRDDPDALPGTALGETDARGEVTLPIHRGAPVVGQVRSAHRRTVPLSRNSQYENRTEYRIDGKLADPMEPGETRTIIVHVGAGLPLDVLVVGWDDMRLPGARVTLTDGLFGGETSKRTDAQGVATFDGIPPERGFTLEAGAPGFATVRASRIVGQGPVANRLQATVKLRPGMLLRGTVLDGMGKPLAGARVRAEVGGPVARTGPDGGYTLEGVPVVLERGNPRPLRVRAEADGFAARSTPEFMADSRPDGSPVPTILLGVGNEIRGVVLDKDRNRLRYPVLEVVGDDGVPVRTDTGSALGEFTLRDVPPGTWRLVALAPGRVAMLPAPLKIEDDVDPPFQTLTARLLEMREFQLVDRSRKPRPVAGARLEAASRNSDEHGRLARLGSAAALPSFTDAEGKLRVAVLSLPRRVRVSLDGFRPEEITLGDEREPRPIELEWHLGRGRVRPR